MKIQGVKDKLVCSIIEQEKVTEGGLFIPETATKDPQLTCKVISVGEEVKGIEADDIIFCHRSGGMDIMFKNQIMKILKFDEVYCVLK